MIDANTIKLQTIGFAEVSDTFTRGTIDDGNDKILDASTPFTNGDVVTYRPAAARTFISAFVDANITLDNPATEEVDEFTTSQDGSNVGRIYVPGHGFTNGQAVVYNALDGVNVPGLSQRRHLLRHQRRQLPRERHAGYGLRLRCRLHPAGPDVPGYPGLHQQQRDGGRR